MQTLTKQELVNLLCQVKGTTFVSIETKTVPNLKKGNPFISLEKVSKVCGAIGFNYQNSVNNVRAKENLNPNFVVRSRAWGSHVNNILVKHKDNFYLQIKVQSAESNYFDKNVRVNIDKVKLWQYNNKTRQNVTNDVIVRNYLIDNISRITINKREYLIC